MSAFFQKIERKLHNVYRFGIVHEVECMLIKRGIKKEKSFRSMQKFQQFYEKMDPKDYPEYVKQWYLDATGRELNLEEPKRFTEKIQWLKIHDSTKIKTLLADKYLARAWVAERIGEEHLIPLYGVWDNFDEIDFEKLPNSFVMKCNHGSGMDIKVQDKSLADKKQMKKKFDQWMKTDFAFSLGCFELHYREIPRKIIAEAYMKNGDSVDLQDYKFYCFHGKPMYCQVIGERSTNETIDFFDMDWNHLPFVGLNPDVENAKEAIEKPKTFEQMVKASEAMSKEFSFVRVDLYEINGKMYFGEMTFTPASGSGSFRPDEMDYKLGEMIKL